MSRLQERVAAIIDADAWAALNNGRDGPGTLWHLRRDWSMNKAAQIIELITRPAGSS